MDTQEITFTLPATVAGVVFLVHRAFLLIAKTIPDHAGGVIGWIRRISKVLSLYVPNKV